MYFQMRKSTNLLSFCKQVKNNSMQVRRLTPIVAPPAGKHSTGEQILMYGGIILSGMAPTFLGLYCIPSLNKSKQPEPEPDPEETEEAAYIPKNI